MDKEGVVVDLESHAVVAAMAAGVLEGVDVDVEEPVVVRRYQQMILMPIWRSIMQNQCRQIEGIISYHISYLLVGLSHLMLCSYIVCLMILCPQNIVCIP